LEKNQKTIFNRDDALSRQIILYVQLGQYDKAIDLLESHHFHVWEGGGKIHNEYVEAHLMRGLERFKIGRNLEALKDYEAALDYPENLEVGKPYHGGRHSEIFYFIGTVHEASGDIEKAKTFYQKSVASKRGWSKICYYQGLAYRKLDQKDEANKMFDGLISFGRERLEDNSSVDYFAKFGKKQSKKMRMADAYYLQGLGYLGKDKKKEAKMKFEKALKLNINHFGARRQLFELK
jgi:tetratricopeptide (TPR) repeat protein